MRRQAKHHEHVGMMEQPEDLGKTRYERIPQHQPASMWQFPPFELALREGMRTCVFSQLDCGSESVKPTLASTEASRPPTWNHVRRQANFQHRRFLCWALPQREGAALIGRHQGSFRTVAAAAWPGALCKWAAIIAAYRKYSAMQEGEGNGNKKRPLLDKENPEEAKRRQLEEEQPVDPMKPLFSGGDGPPRSCTWKGYQTPFQDGGSSITRLVEERQKKIPHVKRLEGTQQASGEGSYRACRWSGGEGIFPDDTRWAYWWAHALYWWARFSGALIRFTHCVVGPRFLVEMLLYANDPEVIAPARGGRIGAVLVFLVMAAAGAPFKWQKQCGGWITERVGASTDCNKLALGLSER